MGKKSAIMKTIFSALHINLKCIEEKCLREGNTNEAGRNFPRRI